MMTGSLAGNAEENCKLSSSTVEPNSELILKIRRAAKIVSDIQFVNGLYSAFDGYIISYSVFKLYFDMISPPGASSSDEMHDWLLTPEGIATVASQSIAIIGMSLISGLFKADENTKNFIKIALAWVDWAWRYFRDAFKGLKFTYKGLRSTIQLFNLLGTEIQSYVLLPLGLTFGILALINKVVYRALIMDPRKAAIDKNSDLLKQARALGADYEFCEMPDDQPDATIDKTSKKLYVQIDKISKELKYRVYSPEKQEGVIKLDTISDKFTDEKGDIKDISIRELEKFYSQQILFQTTKNGHTTTTNTREKRANILRQINEQKQHVKGQLLTPNAWFYSLFSGFTDGLYTYMGVLLFAPMATPILLAMTALSALFVAICILNRCHEEYEYQQELRHSQLTVKLTLCSKEIEDFFWRLQARQEGLASNLTDDQIEKPMDEVLKEFDSTKQELKEIIYSTKLSYSRGALKGMQIGLYAYSAFAAFLFVVASFSAVFPVMLLVIGLPTILAMLIACVATSMFFTYKARAQLEREHIEDNLKDKDKIRTGILSYIISAKTASLDPNNAQIEIPSYEEKYALENAMYIQPCPQYPIQEICDTVRAANSGFGKGPKAIDFGFNFLLHQNEKGHYKETPELATAGAGLAVVYAGAYALRTFGKKLKANEKELPASKSHVPDNMDYTFLKALQEKESGKPRAASLLTLSPSADGPDGSNNSSQTLTTPNKSQTTSPATSNGQTSSSTLTASALSSPVSKNLNGFFAHPLSPEELSTGSEKTSPSAPVRYSSDQHPFNKFNEVPSFPSHSNLDQSTTPCGASTASPMAFASS